MNFLAHHVIATRHLKPLGPFSAYVAGNALPDLLPLAAPRVRLRPNMVAQASALTAVEGALRAGVEAHLGVDAAFHKSATFAEAQARGSDLLRHAGFTDMRVRVFFLAHVLAELALDAALLRADATLADEFYAALEAADPAAVTLWAQGVVAGPLPGLPATLARFTRARYLSAYADDEGVVRGLNGLCHRTRQDTFEGNNRLCLTACVARMIAWVTPRAEDWLHETADAVPPQPPTTPK